MSDVICITNRALCGEDFLIHLEKIAAARPAAIILREKDMPPDEYRELAAGTMKICARHGVQCILHSFTDVAIRLGADAIHLPLHLLRALSDEEKARFDLIGASCHSVQDAIEAQRLGCSYITAGHVFETDCKRGLPGRGLEFLKAVCTSVDIPVYAIGGIDAGNYISVKEAGAKGACIMSGLMRCDDPVSFLKAFK